MGQQSAGEHVRRLGTEDSHGGHREVRPALFAKREVEREATRAGVVGRAGHGKAGFNGSDPTKDWDQGYCFQFWRCRHGAYRGDGANGQFCLVLPEQDAVVAITADTRDMQAELNVVWDKLLPAIHPAPLPENAQEQAKLKQTLANLAVPAGHVEKVLKLPGT